jgi:hypothetical protein
MPASSTKNNFVGSACLISSILRQKSKVGLEIPKILQVYNFEEIGVLFELFCLKKVMTFNLKSLL